MKPEEAARLLHAYVDGELDPSVSQDFEACLACDPALRAAHDRLRAMSAAIREKADYHAVPASLSARIMAALPDDGKAPRNGLRAGRRWFIPAGVFAASAALALAAVLVQLGRGDDERFVQEMLASHGRAALAGRAIDIASADRHTVKPWLSARLPYSPPVADAARDGYPLAGGRLDYVGGKPVAVLVYKRRQHSIEAFVWPGSAAATRSSRDGINFESFSRQGMTYWLVSDLDPSELEQFARVLGKP
jgi:anti-sigma factor RsiW